MKKSKIMDEHQTFAKIYSAENKETGEFYIGVTTNEIATRRKDHERKAKNESKIPFHKAISTYGPDAFEWNQIDTASSLVELAEKEKEYIVKYNAKEEGYNSDLGGGITKPVYQFDLETNELIGKYDSVTIAADAVGVDKSRISAACLGKTKTSAGFHWSFNSTASFLRDDRKKPLLQIDDTAIIGRYKSISQASKMTGINKTSIAKVCRGERKHAGGFCWKFE